MRRTQRESDVPKAPASGERATPVHERRILGAVDNATSGWLKQMEAMRRMEGELGIRLMEGGTAGEAIGLSTEWLAKRLDSLIAVQHRLIELWLECDAVHSVVAAECRRSRHKRRGR